MFGIHLKLEQKSLRGEERDLTIVSALKVAETEETTIK